MTKYINYSELTEEEKKEISKKNRKCLEDLNKYLETHSCITYKELYKILGVPTLIDMIDRPIDRWPD